MSEWIKLFAEKKWNLKVFPSSEFFSRLHTDLFLPKFFEGFPEQILSITPSPRAQPFRISSLALSPHRTSVMRYRSFGDCETFGTYAGRTRPGSRWNMMPRAVMGNCLHVLSAVCFVPSSSPLHFFLLFQDLPYFPYFSSSCCFFSCFPLLFSSSSSLSIKCVIPSPLRSSYPLFASSPLLLIVLHLHYLLHLSFSSSSCIILIASSLLHFLLLHLPSLFRSFAASSLLSLRLPSSSAETYNTFTWLNK